MRHKNFFPSPLIILIFPIILGLVPAGLDAQDVLRGEIRIELEPIYGGFYIEDPYPLPTEEAYRRALELAAYFFSAQIYGWSFYYDIGERARGIEEEFTLTPLGQVHWGDPRLRVTHAHFQNYIFSIWVDYRPGETQAMRLNMWRTGTIRTAQATGYSPLGAAAGFSLYDEGTPMNWLAIRIDALEDAARAAVRAMLQGMERNRPKEAAGFISLQNFPGFYVDSGRWAVNARFRVDITDIVPFAAH